MRCDGDDGGYADPDVGRDAGEGDVRRIRSSMKGVFCSRLMVGALIDDGVDDDDDAVVTVGRGSFEPDSDRNSAFCCE